MNRLRLMVILAATCFVGCGEPSGGGDAAAGDFAPGPDVAKPADSTMAGDLSTAPDLSVLPDLVGADLAMVAATTLVAQLSGSQEVPPVTTAAVGNATVVIDGARTSVDVTLESALLATATAAHIHFGRPGNAGPVMLGLLAAPGASPLKKVLTANDFMPVNGGPQTFADAVKAILEGNTYINVHTMANPGGEIRGHLGGIKFTALLSGAQEVPQTMGGAGTATITLNDAHDQIDVTLDAGLLANITASHIHAGPPGRGGPVILPISAAFMGMTSKTLKAADLAPAMAYGINTFSDAVIALLAGGTYVNVHTMANPGGEIRGAVGAVTLFSAMSPVQEVGNIVSVGTGAGITTVDIDQTHITTRLTVASLVDITAAHYHVGLPGANGPVIFPLAAASFNSPLNKSLAAVDLTPQVGQGVSTFGDAINAVLSGRAYLNVHTMVNPGGELRGQVGPVTLKAILTGASEVPPVVTAATGTATVVILGDQSAIDVTVTVANLNNTTASHIHAGAVGANGPVILGLAAAMFNSPLKKTLVAADLMPSMAQGVNNFADAINALLAQKTYINAHTQANPGGEIRGQVTP